MYRTGILVFFFLFSFSSCYVFQRADLRVKISEVVGEKQKENLSINRLIVKKDSLSSNGLIYDSVSTAEGYRLAIMKVRSDSLLRELVYLKRRADFRVAYFEDYDEIRKGIKNAQREWMAAKQGGALTQIEKRLDDAYIGGEKAILKGMLNSASGQQEKETKTVMVLSDTKDKLLASGNVPAVTGNKLDERFRIYQHRMDSINKEISKLGKQIESPSDFSKNFTIIKAKVILIDSVVNKNAGAREYILNMIQEGLSKSEPKIFSLGAFFGPGGYHIPAQKFDTARKYFSPIIDSLLLFSNAHTSVLRTATVIVNGHADASNISAGSKLYDTLIKVLNKQAPSSKELNTALSSLRAEEISNLLTNLLKERANEFTSIDKVFFESIEKGMGEQLPSPKITDYKKNDDRRRVVLIFWNVLPND